MRLVFWIGVRLLELRRLKQAPSTVHVTCDGMCYVGHYLGNYLRHFKIEIYEKNFFNVKHYLSYSKEWVIKDFVLGETSLDFPLLGNSRLRTPPWCVTCCWGRGSRCTCTWWRWRCRPETEKKMFSFQNRFFHLFLWRENIFLSFSVMKFVSLHLKQTTW